MDNVTLHGLTHWGRVTHTFVGTLTIIGLNNGLSPSLRQAIIYTNGGLLLIEPLGTYFSEISIGIQTFLFKKINLNMSAKWRPFCPGLNVLKPESGPCHANLYISSRACFTEHCIDTLAISEPHLPFITALMAIGLHMCFNDFNESTVWWTVGEVFEIKYMNGQHQANLQDDHSIKNYWDNR